MRFRDSAVNRSSKDAYRQQTDRLALDVIAFCLIISSAILSYFIFTQSIDVQLSLALKMAFGASFVFAGMIFRPVAVPGLWNFRGLDAASLLKTVIGGSLAFLALITVVFIKPPLAAVTFPEKLFYANMAIIEETFFNYFLFAWFCTLFPWYFAALLDSAFFAPFHLGVYGWDPQFMAFSIGARFVLCLVYYWTGSLSSAMGAHMLFNVMASAASVTSLNPAALGLSLAFFAPYVMRLIKRRRNGNGGIVR